MTDIPSIDVEAAHRYFSVTCFNAAWEYIEKEDRRPDDDEQMVHLSLASLWHWLQRTDCTAKEQSIGFWQVSRVYVLAGRPDMARWYAERCLEVTEDAGLPPFYMGYAYEALARAALAARDRRNMVGYLTEARRFADKEENEEDRDALLDDLATIK